MSQVSELYLAIDGDDVGHRLEYFILTNDSHSLRSFSSTFASAMAWLEQELRSSLGLTLIFSGGDNLLACLNADSDSNDLIDLLERLRNAFAERAESTLSVGVGGSPREAYLALKLAKASGKDCIQRVGGGAGG